MHTRFLLLPIATCAASLALSGSTIGYFQTNLVSDGAVPANVIDPDLKNPWGISFGPTTPFWVADNGTGLSTLYAGDGTKQGLVVTIPPAPGSAVGTLGTPTGTVFNSTPGNFFGDRFVFATEAGTIAGWQPALGTTASVRADNSGSGAVYKGLAIAGGNIYATDFAGNKIDVWTNGYTPPSLTAGAFTDPNLPDGFAPFGIQNIGGSLYVTYARKQPGGDDDVAGPGFGIVDKYDTNGNLLQRVINPGGALNSPWGLALAPAGFGDFSGLLLVGNFGDGTINGFDPITGMFVSSLNDHGGSPIVIDGLWSLAFGNGGPGFDQHKLYFTAGLNDEEDGLLGAIAPVPEPGTMVLIGLSFSSLLLARHQKPGPVRLSVYTNERGVALHLNWILRVPLRRSVGGSGRVEVHADYPNQSVQGASVSGRGDHSLRAVVPAISTRLRTRCRTLGGTRRGSGPQLHLAVDAGLCSRTEQTLPPLSKADQQKLPHGRDLYKGEGEDKYLYRAVDSTGQTIEFLLTAKRMLREPNASSAGL